MAKNKQSITQERDAKEGCQDSRNAKAQAEDGFGRHERLSRRLDILIYFAHAYSSNERATNENTNGLLRQYFPKKPYFLDISHHALAYVTERLNNRPLKRLDYLTPIEALTKAGFVPQM